MNNPVDAQSPGGDRFFIVRAESSRDHILFAPLDNFPPDLGHSPAIQSMVSRSPGVCIPGFNSRCQLLNRVKDGLTESIRSSSARPPCKGFTGFSAGQPQFDIVHSVDH